MIFIVLYRMSEFCPARLLKVSISLNSGLFPGRSCQTALKSLAVAWDVQTAPSYMQSWAASEGKNVLSTSEPARKCLRDKKRGANRSKIQSFKTKRRRERRRGDLRTPSRQALLRWSALASRKTRKTAAKSGRAPNDLKHFIIYGQRDV